MHRHTDVGHQHNATTNAATRTVEMVDNDDERQAAVCGDELHNANVTIDIACANLSDPTNSLTEGSTPVRVSDETRPVNAYVNFIIKD